MKALLKPAIAPVNDQNTNLQVKGVEGSTVVVKDNNNNVIGTVVLGKGETTKSLQLNQPLKAGTVLTATATKNGKTSYASDPVTVTDVTAPVAPMVNEVTSEGTGYIITGTFLVAIVKSIPEFADYAALSWMFVGLGAIPSTILWSMMAEKLGYSKATNLAFILQIIAVILPVFSESITSLVISSILFGATFLGLTTLFMSKAQTLMFQSNSKINLVASLTVIYSLGQMIAPALSGVLIGESGNYNAALIFASIILCVGLLSSMYSYRVTN
ncbi:YbfB/YjiJ family MFS transporter [Staphylococcus sp. IPLA37010]|uniref:YbfB/YjiJ family MFS transporter n=2 Tax=Staphylococcus equorum TaxID=246432 RepID=A0AAW7AEK8_9STAP|nr:YbfB/YjiJ family MFS transporter [Staphylococcus equorum]MDK9843957.1 YbfB/YjiJ family MFS transporter [Staphylococcus equorum]MDK9864576.1 YbfB/YjiJ family MFS transporter [Staphylococcus equorum]